MDFSRRQIQFLFLLVLCAPSTFADLNLGPWKIHYSHPTPYPKELTHDGGKYVLVDGYGHIFTSISGRNWTVQSTPSIRPLNSIASGPSNFIAIGKNGVILSSPNGTNWIDIPSPITNQLNKVAYTGNEFLIVGDNGTMLTSTNATDFTLLDPITTSNLTDIATGPGTTLATGTLTVLVSTNTAEWKPATVTTTNLFSTVIYYNGAYHNGWYSSADPMIWTNKLGNTSFTNIFSLAIISNSFSTILARATQGGIIQYSFNGGSWINVSTLRAVFPRLTSISNVLHAVNTGIYRGAIPGSANLQPLHISLAPDTAPFVLGSIDGDTNGYIANGTYFSSDGQSWRPKTNTDPIISADEIAYSQPPFARARNVPPPLGSGSAITESSDDGVTWNYLSTPNGTRHVAALGESLAASDGYKLWTKTNRFTQSSWTAIATNFGPLAIVSSEGGGSEGTITNFPWIVNIHSGHGYIIALSAWGEILSTTDAITWRTNKTALEGLNDFTFTPNGILAIGGRLIAEARFDGQPVQTKSPVFKFQPNEITFDVAPGYYEIESSADLQSWTNNLTTTTNRTIPISTEAQQFFRAAKPD